MCFNDMMAIGAISRFWRESVSVPGDISVVGFDDIAFAAYTYPPLTTFEQPKYELGASAAQMLLGRFRAEDQNTPQEQPMALSLRGSMIVRESTAPPRDTAQV